MGAARKQRYLRTSRPSRSPAFLATCIFTFFARRCGQVCGHWSVPSLFFPRHNLPTDPRTSTASLNSCSWFERAHSIVINIYILRLLHRAFLNQHLTAQHREATTIWLAFSNRATLKVSPPTSRSILLAVSHGLGSAPDAPCSHNRAQALPSLWTVRHLYSPSRRAN